MLIKEFIGKIDGMQFFYVDDFYDKKENIRDKYQTLNDEEKNIYKWYFFYQLCFVKSKIKSIFWDYVNGKGTDDDISKEYDLYCKRREEISNTMRNKNINSNI